MELKKDDACAIQSSSFLGALKSFSLKCHLSFWSILFKFITTNNLINHLTAIFLEILHI